MARMIETHDGWVLRDDWYAEDIYSVADCMEVELTEDMVMKVMHYMADNYDLNIGLNWEVAEDAIQTILDKENAK